MTGSEDKEGQEDKWLAIWFVRTGYQMEEFNEYSSSDEYNGGFPPVNAGMAYVLEISALSLDLPKTPIIRLNELPIMAMVEYYNANTTRTAPTRSEWNLPVLGLSVASVLRFNALGLPSWLAIRPSAGYYRLGFLGREATLKQQYVTGARSFSGSAIGWQVALRAEIQRQPLLGAEFGYRSLEFADVKQTSSGEWLGWDKPEMPFLPNMDFGGLFAKAGFGLAW